MTGINFKNDRLWLLLFLLIAVILRTIYLFEIKRIPFFDYPVADSRIYFDQAMKIYNGDLFPHEPSFHSSPVYPYFLALTYAPAKSLAGPRVVQALCGVINIVVVYLITIILFGRIPALISAFLMSVYPLFICFEGDLLMIPIVVLTLNLSCLMFVYYQKSLSIKYLLLSGIFIGLSALGKPDTLLIAPAMALWLVFSSINKKQGLKLACVLALCVTAPILPVTISNYVYGKDIVLLTTNGGINFYIGNHKGANGMFHLPDDSGLWDHKLYLSSKEVAEREMKRALKPSEVSKYWFGKGIGFIISDPLEFLRQFGKKSLLMINKFEVSNHHSFYFFKKYSDSLSMNPLNITYLILFGYIGAALSIGLWKRLMPVYIYLFASFIVCLMFFVTDRYRLPTISFYIIFSSYGVYSLYMLIIEKRWKKTLTAVVPALVLFGLSFINFKEFRITFNQDYNNLGNVYAGLKQYDKALLCYEKVIKNNPYALFNHFNVGNIYEIQGKYELAISEFLKEIEVNPKFADSYNNIAQIYLKKKNLSQAKKYLEKMAEAEVTLSGMINLAYVYFESGDIKKAAQALETVQKSYPDNKDVIKNLITCYKKLGKTDEADKLILKLQNL